MPPPPVRESQPRQKNNGPNAFSKWYNERMAGDPTDEADALIMARYSPGGDARMGALEFYYALSHPERGIINARFIRTALKSRPGHAIEHYGRETMRQMLNQLQKYCLNRDVARLKQGFLQESQVVQWSWSDPQKPFAQCYAPARRAINDLGKEKVGEGARRGEGASTATVALTPPGYIRINNMYHEWHEELRSRREDDKPATDFIGAKTKAGYTVYALENEAVGEWNLVFDRDDDWRAAGA